MHGIETFNGQKFAAVRYIGKQPKHRDTVLNRPNLMWKGQGDVQWVPEVDAAVYIRFTDIWELASDVELPDGGLLPQLARAGAPLPMTDPKAVLGRSPSVPHSLQTPAPYATDPKSETPLAAEAVADLQQVEKLTADLATKRILEICEALGHLKPSDFQPGNGAPNCKSLSKIVKREVLASERDAAWAIVRKQMKRIAEERQTDLGESAPPAEGGDVEPTTEANAPADPDAAIPEL